MLSSMHRLRFPLLGLLLLALLPLVALAHDEDEEDEAAGQHGHAAAHAGAHDPDHAGQKEPSAMDHVMDSDDIHVFDTMWPRHIHLPNILGFQITKFMVLEVLAALLVLAIYAPIARRLAHGTAPSGAWDNAFELLLVFVRDQIARPSIGAQADRYVPFLWTLFLFILFNNLLGMFPFLGSATASIYVTGALALVVFFAIHGSAIVAMGSAQEHGHGHDDGHGHAAAHADHGHAHGAHGAPPLSAEVLLRGSRLYVQSLWPHIDLPAAIGFPIKLLVFCIEVIGILVRNAVLAVRLFANMFAGHMVLATILVFIKMAASVHPALWGTITLSSVLGILALSLLEIFVAFLQAYIFTFLTSLFMGMAISPQH